MEATRGCIGKVETVLENYRPFFKGSFKDIFFVVLVCGVSKDAESKMFKGCTIVLEVWTIRRPLEAVKEN